MKICKQLQRCQTFPPSTNHFSFRCFYFSSSKCTFYLFYFIPVVVLLPPHTYYTSFCSSLKNVICSLIMKIGVLKILSQAKKYKEKLLQLLLLLIHFAHKLWVETFALVFLSWIFSMLLLLNVVVSILYAILLFVSH